MTGESEREEDRKDLKDREKEVKGREKSEEGRREELGDSRTGRGLSPFGVKG